MANRINLEKYNEDYIGKRYGRLTIIGIFLIENRSKSPKSAKFRVMAKCKCDCGNISAHRLCALKSGATRSCGCYNDEIRKKTCLERSTTHNKGYTRIYHIWNSMQARCYNPKSAKYPDYGGRGIYICDEWKRSGPHKRRDGNIPFENFYDWSIKNGYYEQSKDTLFNDRLSIDRIDPNGPYAPWNCRWTTNIKQAQNRRDTRYAYIDGEYIPLTRLLHDHNVPAYFISNAIARDWSYVAIIYSVLHPDIKLKKIGDSYIDQDGFVRLLPNCIYGGQINCINSSTSKV